MNVVITGGAGFLGTRLARKLTERNALTDASGRTREIASITLVDVVPAPPFDDKRVRSVVGDLGDATLLAQAVPRDTDTVFHLAAVVSGQAEAEFDVGMRVNLDVTRALLERCRKLASPPKFVFTSSLAVFGGPRARSGARRCGADAAGIVRRAEGDRRVPRVRHEPQRHDRRPLASPADRHRAAGQTEPRGVVVRERHHPRAACGRRSDLSGGARKTRMWVQSPRAVIDNLLVGHEAPASSFTYTRSINVPGISVAVGDMVSALREVAGDDVAARVKLGLRSRDRPHRVDVAVELRPEAGACDRHARGCGLCRDRPRLHGR